MASDLDTLVATRSALYTTLQTLLANPKPNYSIDGQSVSWADLYTSLWNQIDKLNLQITIANGPFEEPGQAVT